jgi:hypothetical protein
MYTMVSNALLRDIRIANEAKIINLLSLINFCSSCSKQNSAEFFKSLLNLLNVSIITYSKNATNY